MSTTAPGVDRLSDAGLHELRAELAGAVAADDRATRARVLELIAANLAARGEWQRAYRELRRSVDLDRRPSAPRDPQLVAEVTRLRRETDEARSMCLRDSLTGSFNRRFLDQQLRQLTRTPHSAAATLALVDLDMFKLVNDRFGHPLGDRVLQEVVELLQVGLPAGGFCARYGGEEFVLALPAGDAVARCEQARARVAQHAWDAVADGLRVTVSIGVAGPWCALEDGPEVLARADELLYAAKSSGRNAVAYRLDPSSGMRLAGAAAARRVQVDPHHRRGGPATPVA